MILGMIPPRLCRSPVTIAPGSALGLLAAALLLSACRGPGGSAIRATDGTWSLDLATLEKVLPGTFEDMHWGRMNIRRSPQKLTAAALTPDGRTVKLTAEPVATDALTIAARVGRFSDAELEQAFFDKLQRRARDWRRRHPPDEPAPP